MKKFFLMFAYIIITITLTSCWGKKELDERALISALAVDKSEKGYMISIQVMNPGEITGQSITSATPVKIFTDEDDTILKTIRKLTMQMPRKGYYPHLMVVVISEEVAKAGFYELIDFLTRDPEIRPDVNILIAKNILAKDAISQMTHIDKVSANKLQKSMINIETNWLSFQVSNLVNIVNMMASDGINPSILGITIEGDIKEGQKQKSIEDIEPPSITRITFPSVFKDNKLIGWLNEEESRGYGYLLGKLKSTIVSVPCDKNNYYNFEVSKSKNETKIKVNDGKPIIYINFKIHGNISELGCGIDLTKQKESKMLEKKFEEHIKNQAYTCLETLQKKYQSDIVGFGEMIHRKDPKLWKDLKKDWDNHFVDLEIKVEADVNIDRSGMVRAKLKDEIEK